MKKNNNINVQDYIKKINKLNIPDFENSVDIFHNDIKKIIYYNLYPSFFQKNNKPYFEMHTVLYMKLNFKEYEQFTVEEIITLNIIEINKIYTLNELSMIDFALLAIKPANEFN